MDLNLHYSFELLHYYLLEVFRKLFKFRCLFSSFYHICHYLVKMDNESRL